MAPGTFLPENNTILIPDATLGTYFVTAGNIQNALPYTSQRGHVGIMATRTFEPNDSKSTIHYDNDLNEPYAYLGLVGARKVRGKESCSPDMVRKNASKQFKFNQAPPQCSSDTLDHNCKNQLHDFLYEYEEEEDHTKEYSSSLPKQALSKWWPAADSRRNRPLSWQMEDQTTPEAPLRKHNTRVKNEIFTKLSVKENENPREFHKNFEPDHSGVKKDYALERSGHSHLKQARAHNYEEQQSHRYAHPTRAQAFHNAPNKSSLDNYTSKNPFNYNTSVEEGDLTRGMAECKDHSDHEVAYVHRCPFHHCSHMKSTPPQFDVNSHNFISPPKPRTSEQLPTTQILPNSCFASTYSTMSSSLSNRTSPTSSETTSHSRPPLLLAQAWSPPPPHLNSVHNSKSKSTLQDNLPETSRGCWSAPRIPATIPSSSPLQSNAKPQRSSPPAFLPTSVLDVTYGQHSGIPAAVNCSPISEDFKNNIDNANRCKNSSKSSSKEMFVNKYSVFDNFQDDMLTEAEQPVGHTNAIHDSDHEMGDFLMQFRIMESPDFVYHEEVNISNDRGRNTQQQYRAKATSINETDQDEVSRNLMNVSVPNTSSAHERTNAKATHASSNKESGLGCTLGDPSHKISRSVRECNSSGNTSRTKNKTGAKSDRGTPQMPETARANKPAQEVTDSFRKKAIEYIVQQLSGQVGYTCCGSYECRSNDCNATAPKSNKHEGNNCNNNDYSVTEKPNNCEGNTSKNYSVTESGSNNSDVAENASPKLECNNCSDTGRTKREGAANASASQRNSDGKQNNARSSPGHQAKVAPRHSAGRVTEASASRTSAAEATSGAAVLGHRNGRPASSARAVDVPVPAAATSESRSDTILSDTASSQAVSALPIAENTSSTADSVSLIPENAPMRLEQSSMAVNAPSTTENASTAVHSPSAPKAAPTAEETSVIGNTSSLSINAPLPVSGTSSPVNTPPAATMSTSINTSQQTARTQLRAANVSVNTQFRAVNTGATANKPPLQRLYNTISKLEQTVYAAAKGDKEIYMRHLAGKLATVYCQLQHNQQLPISTGVISASDRKNTTSDTNLTIQNQEKVKRY